MSDDYAVPQRRKNKSDKRAKARFMQYKKGGAQRVTGVAFSGNSEQENKK